AIEEEIIPDYVASRFYPTQIGGIIENRYQVVGKPAFGASLTVRSLTKQLGHTYVRSLVDSFDADGPGDKHRCLVHPLLWESVLAFLFRNPVRRLSTLILVIVLHRLFLALDNLHTECKNIHKSTCFYSAFCFCNFSSLGMPLDIKADNICLGSPVIRFLVILMRMSFRTPVVGRS
ncbi:hypothetical protein N7510_006350, partial [Penicillium lagena]|uniref:uncharacterized protein n=1 Tax=Penicillium lagena TaxID=94218 RepID=UPI0025426A4D